MTSVRFLSREMTYSAPDPFPDLDGHPDADPDADPDYGAPRLQPMTSR